MNLKVPEENLNYSYRQYIQTLMQIYGENEQIYLILKQPDNTILNITKQKNDFKYYTNVNIYSGTLKNAFLFLLISQYPQISKELLIFKANKTMKQYTTEEVVKMLGVTKESYNKFNIGLSAFKNNFSKEQLSTKLKFNIQEFEITLNTFKKVV